MTRTSFSGQFYEFAVCFCCVMHNDQPLRHEIVVCRECGHCCSCYGCVAEAHEPR